MKMVSDSHLWEIHITVTSLLELYIQIVLQNNQTTIRETQNLTRQEKGVAFWIFLT